MLERLRGGLVVSCQAYEGEPLQDPHIMLRMAQSAERGGAVGIRAQGLQDVRLIHQNVRLPLIGLVKVPGGPVFITPTLRDALAVAAAGADIVAVDGTQRPRPDGLTLEATIRAVHENSSALVMADCSNFSDGLAAQSAGADIVGTTLAGFTGETPPPQEPALDLVRRLATQVHVPLLAEGRIRTPEEARQALDAGAFAVVVGTSITHPTSITSRFVQALQHDA
jgi:N-acylglucosamine-6-phosphate 2-epimerase